MTDQHRADCLGCAGNKVIKTPNLRLHRRRGRAVLERLHLDAESARRPEPAILTGLSPWHHGMLGYGRIAGQYPFEMPQALRDAGYYLFGIGKMHWYPQKQATRVSRPAGGRIRPGRDAAASSATIAAGSRAGPRPRSGRHRHRLERLPRQGLRPARAASSDGLDRRPGRRVPREVRPAGAVHAEGLLRPAAQPV